MTGSKKYISKVTEAEQHEISSHIHEYFFKKGYMPVDMIMFLASEWVCSLIMAGMKHEEFKKVCDDMYIKFGKMRDEIRKDKK